MDTIYPLFIALLPVALLVYYIFNKETEKEPVKELWIAFGFGVISLFVSLIFSLPFGELGLYTVEPSTIFWMY